MGHELVKGAYGMGTAPWHFRETGADGRSIVVPGLMDVDQMLELSTIGGVETVQVPVYVQYKGEFILDPDHVGVFRPATGQNLGIHTEQYERDEFADHFRTLSSFFGDGAAIWETGVLLRGGKVAAGVMRFPEFDRKVVGFGTVLAYIAAWSSHNGMFGMRYKDTNLRAECMNITRMIDAETNGRQVSVRHRAGKDEKRREGARIMSFAQERAEAAEAEAIRLLKIKLSQREVREVLEAVIPVPADSSDRLRTRRLSKHATILDIYNNADDQQDMRGTALGLVQATAAFVGHRATNRNTVNGTAEQHKFASIVLKGGTLDQKVLELVGR
jgi:phage/plasmid-like protein (TIGR03299 family)